MGDHRYQRLLQRGGRAACDSHPVHHLPLHRRAVARRYGVGLHRGIPDGGCAGNRHNHLPYYLQKDGQRVAGRNDKRHTLHDYHLRQHGIELCLHLGVITD